MNNPSTIDLAKLRKLAQDPDYQIPSLEDQKTLLQSFFQRSQVCCADNSHSDQFIALCYELWDILSNFESPFRLPNRYTNESTHEIFSMIFRRVFCLETDTGSVGGNIVLNGVKGVGKTTILIVSGVLAACLTKHVVPLYWIFEKSTRDLQYISMYKREICFQENRLMESIRLMMLF
jgi:hypothetical protein